MVEVGFTEEEACTVVAACMEEACTAVARFSLKLKTAQPLIQTCSSNSTLEERCNQHSVIQFNHNDFRWTSSNTWPSIWSSLNG